MRFLCGTQPIHLELEDAIARFPGDGGGHSPFVLLCSNEAFLSALLGNEFGCTDYRDIIYSDQLNHASIIRRYQGGSHRSQDY